jgi:hypothetical protein
MKRWRSLMSASATGTAVIPVAGGDSAAAAGWQQTTNQRHSTAVGSGVPIGDVLGARGRFLETATMYLGRCRTSPFLVGRAS